MLYVTGDVHYPIDSRHLFDLEHLITSNDTLIVCGDMGLVWDNAERSAKAIAELTKKISYTLLFVDGNHEHFPLLNAFPQEAHYNGTVGKLSDRIFHLRRAESYVIDGYRILTFGGARSEDRYCRVEGDSWFPEEEFTSADLEKLYALLDKQTDFDFVITHEAPMEIVEQIYSYASQVGFSRTQQLLSVLSERITFKKWYFGHHHISRCFGSDNKYICLYDDARVLDTGSLVLLPRKGMLKDEYQ